MEIISKRCVNLKNRVSRLWKVCIPCKNSMETQAGEKHRCPRQETSYECVHCTMSFYVALCFSLYHQFNEYENKMKKKDLRTEIQTQKYLSSFTYTLFSCILFCSLCIMYDLHGHVLIKVIDIF